MAYKKTRKKLPVTRLTAYLLVAAVLTLGASFSRYSTSGQSADAARVAAFVLMGSDSSTSTDLLLENMAPGDTVEYHFTVSNFQDSAVCEVAQSYTVSFSDFDNLPLEYELKKDAASYMLPANTKTTNDHILSITWPENDNDAALADEIDLVTITVTSNQVN